MSALQQYLASLRALLFLLNLALASCLACGLGLAALRFCRDRSAPFRHGLLVAVLILLALSPSLVAVSQACGVGGFRLPLIAPGAEIGQSGPLMSVLARHADPGRAGIPNLNADDAGVAGGAGLRFLLPMFQAAGTCLALVWAAGSTVMAVRFVCGLGVLARLRKTLTAVHDTMVNQTAAEACRAMGISGLKVYETPLTLAPFSLGLFRPVIVLPDGLAGNLSEEQLRYVLLHEAAHIRRLDLWVALLQFFCTALFWWNPLRRAVHRRIERLREQICDDFVICAGGSGRGIAEVLVSVAEWGFCRPRAVCSAALLDEDGRDLQERIGRLLRQTGRRTAGMGAPSLIGIAAFGLWTSAALVACGVRAAPAPKASQGETAWPAARAPAPAEPGRRLESPAESLDPMPEKAAEPPPGQSKRTLAGDWQMRLPAGFVHSVTLTSLGGNRYRLEPRKLNSSGVYEVRDGRLTIIEPNDRRLLGFEWEIQSDGQLKLVGQPPLRETGSNYVGATMIAATK
ncbi:MAG: M56 family metallopeptidase [Planctomycetia bacterium]|nr:M56 family metallopeptidase [Planctomycetia bacterium]